MFSLSDIRFVYYNPNPWNHNFDNDCYIRAVSKALNLSYKRVAKMMFQAFMKKGLMMGLMGNVSYVLARYGWIWMRLSSEVPILEIVLSNRNMDLVIEKEGHLTFISKDEINYDRLDQRDGTAISYFIRRRDI